LHFETNETFDDVVEIVVVVVVGDEVVVDGKSWAQHD
jgi:hypothetical protein